MSSDAIGCEWFALCVRPAIGTLAHPILGPVPICRECSLRPELSTRPVVPFVFADVVSPDPVPDELSDDDWLEAITPRALELDHSLTVFNAVDVPFDVQAIVIGLLAMYDVDVYTRPCDATGKATA